MTRLWDNSIFELSSTISGIYWIFKKFNTIRIWKAVSNRGILPKTLSKFTWKMNTLGLKLDILELSPGYWTNQNKIQKFWAFEFKNSSKTLDDKHFKLKKGKASLTKKLKYIFASGLNSLFCSSNSYSCHPRKPNNIQIIVISWKKLAYPASQHIYTTQKWEKKEK